MEAMRLAVLVWVVAACGGSGGGDDDGPPPLGSSGPFFENPMFFNRDVSTTTPAANSNELIASIRARGGWGNGDTMQIDFSFDVLKADASTEMREFEPTENFFNPDCDRAPVPVPANGNVEGEEGYECTTGGDCHLIVFDESSKILYEMLGASITNQFDGGCLAVWDGKLSYGDTLRGDQCTSADAAGFPIAPLLFTADEVAAGEIDHAIRFILPNNRIQRGYVRPATHGTDTTGADDAPFFGVHLRLRADYPIDTLPSEGAKVVARAMQKYGMYHSDGGNIALTGQTDRYTTAKWDGLLDPHDLSDLAVEDFAVIDHGGSFPVGDCER
jgi:hypothetical protein